MSDSKTVALTVTGKADKRLVITQGENQFIPKTKIKMTDGEVVMVPQDAIANKNAMIILAEAARTFVARQMRKLSDSGRPLTPQEIKELVSAAKLANDMTITAHEEIIVPSDKFGKAGSGPAGQALKTVEAAARGMAQGSAAAALDKFIAMGRNKEKKVEVIDVEATVVADQP